LTLGVHERGRDRERDREYERKRDMGCMPQAVAKFVNVWPQAIVVLMFVHMAAAIGLGCSFLD
jgi:hypothetical protein